MIPDSFAAVGAAWEALEREAPGASIFQSWGWVGCLADERFPDPVLLRAMADDGRLLGLALFNRRGGRACLTESGDPGLDAPFIEHNAPLVAAGPQAESVTAALLGAAWRIPGVRRLVLGGVAPSVLAAAGGTAWRQQFRFAPAAELDGSRGTSHLAGLSANARQQIRRSGRRLEALGGGPLRIEAARTEDEARDWFVAMVGLHTATWQRRGKPGAFVDPFMLRFHHALLPRALARGQLDLLRVTAGTLEVGYLYNFRRGGRVFAYQSGFRPAGDSAQEKPGLTCHAMAIERARACGDRVYDFLAGDARYKRTLGKQGALMAWAELVPRWSMHGMAARVIRRIRPPQGLPGSEGRE